MMKLRKRVGLTLLLALLACGLPAAAQQPAGEGGQDEAGVAEDERWRDVSAYPFPAVGATVQAMQFLAIALQLREYCADARIPDEFVRERLGRFSAMTGREETCPSLLDY